MATSLWFTASDQATSRETIKLHLGGPEETKPELVTKIINRGRKPSKAPQQKKQPQRGLGVAQLERLRLQEPRNKMTDTPQLQPLNRSGQFQLQTFKAPTLAVTEPFGGVPVQYGTVNFSGGPVLINGSGDALFGVNKAGLVIQSSGNLTGYGYNVGGLTINHVMVDPSFYGIFGVFDPKLFHVNNIGAAYETSKELSSIPNTVPSLSSGSCDTCCKGVEVVAVHRKGNTGHGGGGLMMEYEFFPAAYKTDSERDRGSYPEDMEILLPPSEDSVNYSLASYEAAASTTTTTTYGADNTNFVDLSLKLSY